MLFMNHLKYSSQKELEVDVNQIDLHSIENALESTSEPLIRKRDQFRWRLKNFGYDCRDFAGFIISLVSDNDDFFNCNQKAEPFIRIWFKGEGKKGLEIYKDYPLHYNCFNCYLDSCLTRVGIKLYLTPVEENDDCAVSHLQANCGVDNAVRCPVSLELPAVPSMIEQYQHSKVIFNEESSLDTNEEVLAPLSNYKENNSEFSKDFSTTKIDNSIGDGDREYLAIDISEFFSQVYVPELNTESYWRKDSCFDGDNSDNGHSIVEKSPFSNTTDNTSAITVDTSGEKIISKTRDKLESRSLNIN